MLSVCALCFVVVLVLPVPCRPENVSLPDSNFIQALIDFAALQHDDFIVDLGCLDGRVLVGAAQRIPGIRGTGIDRDPVMIRIAQLRASAAGVEGRIRFIMGDPADAVFDSATVVLTSLYPETLILVSPRLRRDLQEGSRVISRNAGILNWQAAEIILVGQDMLLLWRIGAERD